MSDRLAQYKRGGTSKRLLAREEKMKEIKRKRGEKFMGKRAVSDKPVQRVKSKFNELKMVLFLLYNFIFDSLFQVNGKE